MYFFEHADHVADEIIKDGWKNARYEEAGTDPS